MYLAGAMYGKKENQKCEVVEVKLISQFESATHSIDSSYDMSFTSAALSKARHSTCNQDKWIRKWFNITTILHKNHFDTKTSIQVI